VQLKEEGIRPDIIKAIMANGDDDLVRVTKFARELQKIAESQPGKDLLFSYNRAANIVVVEEKKDSRKYDQTPSSSLLATEEEKHLYKAIENISGGIQIALKEESFKDVLEMAASMKKAINDFFDKVLVNDKDAEVRANRLYLLSQYRKTLDSIANFSLIES
jgi:glycyl-tRNA synthetase beta chain